MMDFSEQVTLGDDTDAFTAEARFTDKGKGRYVDWRVSFQLDGVKLEEGGCYELQRQDGSAIDVVVDSCENLGTRCIVGATVQGDITPLDSSARDVDEPPPPTTPQGELPPWAH